MLPKGPWGWRDWDMWSGETTVCSSCWATHDETHEPDCATARIESVFAEVVGALRLVEDPQSRDLASTVNAVRNALAAVEKLSKGE